MGMVHSRRLLGTRHCPMVTSKSVVGQCRIADQGLNVDFRASVIFAVYINVIVNAIVIVYVHVNSNVLVNVSVNNVNVTSMSCNVLAISNVNINAKTIIFNATINAVAIVGVNSSIDINVLFVQRGF